MCFLHLLPLWVFPLISIVFHIFGRVKCPFCPFSFFFITSLRSSPKPLLPMLLSGARAGAGAMLALCSGGCRRETWPLAERGPPRGSYRLHALPCRCRSSRGGRGGAMLPVAWSSMQPMTPGWRAARVLGGCGTGTRARPGVDQHQGRHAHCARRMARRATSHAR